MKTKSKRKVRVKSESTTQVWSKIIAILESRWPLHKQHFDTRDSIKRIIHALEELLKMYKMKLERLDKND